MKHLLFIAFIIGGMSVAFSQKKYAEMITAKDLKTHLYVLASDSLEGRETGMLGQKKAARYMKKHFQALGIPPINNLKQGYYQEFPLEAQKAGNSFLNVGSDTIYDFFEDFFYFRGFENGVYSADDVLFLGYGIESEFYNDYKDVDVFDKIIVILKGAPKSLLKENKKQADFWTKHWRTKVQKAKEKGVKAVIILDDHYKVDAKALDHYINKDYVRLKTDSNASKYAPHFHVSKAVQNSLFNNSPYPFKKAKKKTQKTPFSFTIKTSVEIAVNRKKKDLSSENVLGYIEGTDKKEELVVLTAHYDHLGKKDGKIYYGADDDASGTAALLEIAESFKKAKQDGKGPRRSVLIMPVSGEEKGLLGSKYYTDFPVFDLKNTVANLNIDMIGRIDTNHTNGNYVYLIGSDKLSSELHNISEKANTDYTKIDLDYRYNVENEPNRFYYRSDHYNFAKNNIPVIFYFNGVHADYHKHTDTKEKIDFQKMENITRLIFYTAWELVNREERIVVDSNKK